MQLNKERTLFRPYVQSPIHNYAFYSSDVVELLLVRNESGTNCICFISLVHLLATAYSSMCYIKEGIKGGVILFLEGVVKAI